VPTGLGYSDTVTFQYNYVDGGGQFHPGIQLPTGRDPVTVGSVVARPLAPLSYANIVYSTATASDIYNLTLTTNGTPVSYAFSSIAGGNSFSELVIPASPAILNSQLYTLGVSTAHGLYIQSLTLGYN
jgi:hypothetical protein